VKWQHRCPERQDANFPSGGSHDYERDSRKQREVFLGFGESFVSAFTTRPSRHVQSAAVSSREDARLARHRQWTACPRTAGHFSHPRTHNAASDKAGREFLDWGESSVFPMRMRVRTRSGADGTNLLAIPPNKCCLVALPSRWSHCLPPHLLSRVTRGECRGDPAERSWHRGCNWLGYHTILPKLPWRR